MTFNGANLFTAEGFRRDACVHDLFAAQAARTPNAPALVFKERCLTYREVNQQADALAHTLSARGIGTNDLIGISAERAIELPVAMLAVLKAGAAYLPLEPSCPDDRRAAIFEDAEPAALLTQRHLASRFAAKSRPTICLDDEIALRGTPRQGELSAAAKGADLAYVIYTSGSTGKPKGVLIEHRSLANHATAISQLYGLHPGDRVLQFASFAFDVAAEEIFPTWVGGATVVMWPVISGVAPISKFAEFVDAAKITVLNLPASYWHEWVSELDRVGVPSSVRLVIVGSEKVFSDRAAVWQKHAAGRVRLVNAYGPTEATITATVYEAPRSMPKTSDCLPIGRPIANVQTYVLDENLNAVPPGTAGELYIGGICLARGYLNRPEQTAERFVASPFSAGRERLYRTGDLVRSLPGGDLEFLGRLDDQVKVRGFRIETGEIETVLRQHPAARNAVVIAREDRPGTKQIVAYLAVENTNRPSQEALRQFLKARLPDYMIPAAFVLLKTFPLTPGGKVDRRQLPSPEIPRDEAGKEYVAPRTQLEGELVKIWESLLEVKPIGIRDNFFELGGHSLLEVRLVAEIENKLGLTLPLIALYGTRTVENLAKILERQRNGQAGSLVLPYRTQGSKPAIFSYGGSTHLADHLGADQPVYWLRVHGSEGEALPPTVEAMAADYFKAIRRIQPHGPYYLIGYCLGALVMFELAQQLVRAGEKAALVFIDPFAPFFPANPLDGSGRPPPRRFSDKLARHCRGVFSAGFLRKVKNLPRAIPRRVRWAKRISKWFLCDLWVRSGRRLPPSLREFYLDQQTDDALHRYVPGIFPGPLMVFRRLDNGTEPQWRALATGEVAMYDGWVDHNEFLEEPYVQVIAAKIREQIERGEIEISEKIDSEKPSRQPKKPTQARHDEIATTVDT